MLNLEVVGGLGIQEREVFLHTLGAVIKVRRGWWRFLAFLLTLRTRSGVLRRTVS